MNIAIYRINNPILNVGEINGTVFFSDIVSTLVTLFFIGGVIIFVFVLLISAINWITSGGDKAKATVAREKMFNAFIGLLILFCIFAIIQVIGTLFNTDLRIINVGDLQILN